MKIVITGGIGCGKSYVSELIIREFLPTFSLYDYDSIVKQLYEDKTIQSALYLNFGTSDRSEISRHVFRNKKGMADLKRIFSEPLSTTMIKANLLPDVVLDIPIWYEYRRDIPIQPDFVVTVACDYHTQVARVKSRDNRTDAEIQRIIDSQATNIKSSDFVVNTNTGVDLRGQLTDILSAMKITTDKQRSSPQIL